VRGEGVADQLPVVLIVAHLGLGIWDWPAGGWWLVASDWKLAGRRIRGIFVFGDAFFSDRTGESEAKAPGGKGIRSERHSE